MFSKLLPILSHPGIAVDLGTANTRLYVSQHNEIIKSPSLINHTGGKTNNISDEYFQYINNKIITKPLRGGVIVDLKNTIALLKPLVKKSRRFFLAPIALACAPTDTTEYERDLLRKALLNAGGVSPNPRNFRLKIYIQKLPALHPKIPYLNSLTRRLSART